MKQHIYHFLHKAACLALLWVCLTPAMGHAQGGITVYSDTVSVLEDAADDIAIADVNLDEIDTIRTQIPSLKDRREDLY